MANTPNLQIPLIAGPELVGRDGINRGFQKIDGVALNKSHEGSPGHWPLWKPGTSYAVGDIAKADGCPQWGYLVCSIAGTTDTTPISGNLAEGQTVNDGTVVWRLVRMQDGAAIIDDESVSPNTVWSSQKIDASLTNQENTLNAKIAAKESTANKGQANGYASLNSSGYVPISQLPPNIKELQVVANITERNAIPNPYEGLQAHVIDATDDPTVVSGWAEYLYSSGGWVKRAESESLDILLNWENLNGIPEAIDKLSEVNGKLHYNGALVYEDIRTVVFIGGSAEIIYPWDGTVQKVAVSCSDPHVTNTDFLVQKQTKADYISKTDVWVTIGGAAFTLEAGEAYGEYTPADTNLSIAVGDVLRVFVIDDAGMSFNVTIKND